MKALEQYIKEGLLNTDISDLDASVVIDGFWNLASDISKGKFSVRDRAVIDKFINHLPAVQAWAASNSILRTDKDAWGIAIKEDWCVILGASTIYEFIVEDNKMKYSPVNASWYMGPSAKSRMEIKREFVKVYEEHGCHVFWVDKKIISLFKK